MAVRSDDSVGSLVTVDAPVTSKGRVVGYISRFALGKADIIAALRKHCLAPTPES